MRQNGTEPIEGGSYPPYQGQQQGYAPQQTQFQGGMPQGYQGYPQQQQYQQPPVPNGYPQQTPPTKKKMALWKKVLIGLGVVVLIGGIAGVASGGKKSETQNGKQVYKEVYSVTAS